MVSRNCSKLSSSKPMRIEGNVMDFIKESLDTLIRGNPSSLDAYLLEVCKNEDIDSTKAEMHIYMLRLDGNNRPRIKDLASFLSYCIIDYCIPPKDIANAKKMDKTYNTTQYTMKLCKKAEGLFTDLKNTGEGGELLLSVMTQSFLKIPQVLCKMPLKTNPQVHYHGADGLYGKYDEVTQKFCLYWGESKLYSNIDDALTKCFDSIKPLLIEEGASSSQRERDLTLFRDNIDFDNKYLEDAILLFLNPDDPNYLKLEYRGVCLVGYDEDAYPKDLSGIEAKIQDTIKNRISEFKSKISHRLKNRAPLDDFRLDVFLVPFSDVDMFRKKFLDVI